MNLLWAKKPEEGMREETESPGLDGFYNTAAVEEMVKKIIVAYLEKNEQAVFCLQERK